MAFSPDSSYTGAIASGDTGSANLMNSLYLQSSSFAELPNTGNAGAMAFVTDSTRAAFYRDSGSSWLVQAHSVSHQSTGVDPIANGARIATGSYTGDGTTSLAVTGVGFVPSYLTITRRRVTDGSTYQSKEIMFTSDVIIDDNSSGGAVDLNSVTGNRFRSNAIISLDANGFTVDDNGDDSDPNANTIVYNFMATG